MKYLGLNLAKCVKSIQEKLQKSVERIVNDPNKHIYYVHE